MKTVHASAVVKNDDSVYEVYVEDGFFTGLGREPHWLHYQTTDSEGKAHALADQLIGQDITDWDVEHPLAYTPGGIVAPITYYGKGQNMEYTTREAALQLGLPPDTVTRYCSRHRIQATKRGGHWFISEAELTRFARERQHGGGRPPKLSAPEIPAERSNP